MRVKNNLDTIIYDYIISSLIMGEYHMGQIISLDDLSQKYEVSRTPVTQAVKLLVKDGILEMQKNGRVKVPEMTKNDLRQICEIRLVLEEYAFKKVFLLMDEHEDAYFENLEKALPALNAMLLSLHYFHLGWYFFLLFLVLVLVLLLNYYFLLVQH